MKLYLFGLWVAFFSVFSFSNPPSIPPLNALLEKCKLGKYECFMIEYYAGTSELSTSTAIEILNRDCNASNMKSCLALGQLFIREKKISDSWEPLAKACFVNFNLACHELRENNLPIPPFISQKFDWGPSWPKEFEVVDLAIINNQREFRQCYSQRNFTESSTMVKINILNGVVNELTLENPEKNIYEKCFIEKLKGIHFGNIPNTSITRYFTYDSIYTEGH